MTGTTEIKETPCTKNQHFEIVNTDLIHKVHFKLFKRYTECVHVQVNISSTFS
jgi:arginyl-tRNA--protein-N-Asp/Glu arginylyltransferase